FGLAIIYNVIYGISAGKVKVAKELKVNQFKLLGLLGILELVGTILFFISIKTASDPAIMSFLQNLVPLFVILLGVTVLKERFSLWQVVGMVVTLGGAVVTSFSGSVAGSGFFVPGTGFMIGATFFIAVGMIISRMYIKKLDPGLLSLNRSLFLFVFAAILIIVKGESLAISNKALFNVAIGSLVGPFLTALSNYSALKYIEASKSSIIQSSKGLFVILGAWMYFSTVPEPFQIAGGLITIIGVVVLITAKNSVRK
ncbi:MAG: DMT family transporter, partial [Bacteroidales bacterium]|nr:DMT family transporter [Bacteroidales bacterium]